MQRLIRVFCTQPYRVQICPGYSVAIIQVAPVTLWPGFLISLSKSLSINADGLFSVKNENYVTGRIGGHQFCTLKGEGLQCRVCKIRLDQRRCSEITPAPWIAPKRRKLEHVHRFVGLTAFTGPRKLRAILCCFKGFIQCNLDLEESSEFLWREWYTAMPR